MPVTTDVTVPTPDIAASTDAPGTTPLTITGPGRALGPVAMPSGLVGAPAISAPAGASIVAVITINSAKKMMPTTSKTPRNLCTIDWCKRFPKGTRDQYTAYWTSILGTAEEQLITVQRWKTISDAAKNALQAAAAPGV
ncbi:hypothetical protein DFH07DRAFT_781189 [Mycena maculata]|uniref:Uncharacterized protein n=1 Tax=Mycena maculata TaxID=230809 RepID=A0AAD7MTQ9_9AGAR|nr:hypothetical protein DFH07DRAFT_781189 [Mycena maculata]